MPEEKPIVYILRGDDRQAIEANIDTFFNSLGDENMAGMNTNRLDGRSASLNDVRAAALALPFLTERRLVVVDDALSPYLGKGKTLVRAEFLAFLDVLPPTTALVLVVPDSRKFTQRAGWQWETLHDAHWLTQWVNSGGNRAVLIDCALPTEGEMPAWIQKKAVEMGGNFSKDAALLLRDFIGNNTQQAYQEIIKLLTFVDYQRPVEGKDVELLTVRDHQSDIFALVDAVGNRAGQQALEKLHILLEEMDFIPLFGMIIRQFRLLIQARELLDSGVSEQDLIKILGVHPFVARKIHGQVRQFDLPTLEAIYHHLLEIDLGEKTGSMPGEVALDLLIARLAQ